MMVPLLGLLFGIMDFGFAIFLRSTLQHAVREGTRYAVTYQVDAGQCQDASIVNRVKGASIGFLVGKESTIHVRYFDPVTFAELTGSANRPGNIVEVSVENYEYKWMAPLFWSSQALWIHVRSSDRMEGLPDGAGAPCR